MDIKKGQQLQRNFLSKIEDVLPVNASLVSELSEVLGISADSAYRRMRGDTALTIYEVIKLCEYFKVAFDTVSGSETGVVTFGYTKISRELNGFCEYLRYILKRLQSIEKAENRSIIYACEDIPVFYNYKYKELAAFKLFYWMKSIMNIPEFEHSKFSVANISDEIKEIGSKIVDCYTKVPAVEIWTDTTIISTIKQIDYYLESGMFESNSEFIAVCEALQKEIQDIQKQAEIQSKLGVNENGNPHEKNYTLYYSDIEITNNCVLINIGGTKSVFVGHHTFNTMDTLNQEYCNETEVWMNNLIKKSTLISGVSEKLRYQFFNKMYLAIDKLKAKSEL